MGNVQTIGPPLFGDALMPRPPLSLFPARPSTFARATRMALVPWAMVVCAAAAQFASASGADPVLDGIKLEGSGSRREQLDRMQLKPFETKLFAGLADWSGTPVTPEEARGKVVVLVFYAGWHKPSRSAVAEAQKLASEFAGKGLVVVGIHNERGFEHAATMAKDVGVSFPFAHDTGNAFRTALNVDNDPDIYIIDRAGQLRFADAETSSMRPAVERLLAETGEQAAAIPGKLAEGQQLNEKAKWKTRDASGVDAKAIPKVTFTPATEATYAKVTWPRIMDRDSGVQQLDDLAKKILKDKPKVNMPTEGYSPSSPDTKGKIIVLYYLDTSDQRQLNVIPLMNRTQEAFLRDAVVIASTTRFNRNTGSEPDDQKKREERDLRYVTQIVADADFNHTATPKEIARDTIGDILVRGKTREELNFAMIISTDGVIRWVGNPFLEHFRPALEALIRVDPGVQARRAAEDAAILESKR